MDSRRSSTLTVVPEAASSGDMLEMHCVGRQVGADRPGEADRRRSWRPEVPRLGSLAPPGTASTVLARSVARGLAQKPSPARPKFPLLQGTLIPARPPTQTIPVSESHHAGSVLSSTHLKKARPLNFMSSLTAAVPSHWWCLGCWQQATQPLKGHPSDFYQVRQYFPHQGTWHLLGRCSRTAAPGEAMCRAHIRHWGRRAAPWEAGPACFWFFPDPSSHPPAPSLGCTVLPGGRRRNCCLAPGLPFVQ